TIALETVRAKLIDGALIAQPFDESQQELVELQHEARRARCQLRYPLRRVELTARGTIQPLDGPGRIDLPALDSDVTRDESGCIPGNRLPQSLIATRSLLTQQQTEALRSASIERVHIDLAQRRSMDLACLRSTAPEHE